MAIFNNVGIKSIFWSHFVKVIDSKYLVCTELNVIGPKYLDGNRSFIDDAYRS